MCREVWSAAGACRAQFSTVPVHGLRIRGHGRSRLVRRLRHRGGTAGARRSPRSPAAHDCARGCDHRARHRQLLVPDRALPGGRRRCRRRRQGVRRRVGIPADGRADRRFRPHHRDQRRGRLQRDHLLCAGARRLAVAARAPALRRGRGDVLVRPPRPPRLRGLHAGFPGHGGCRDHARLGRRRSHADQRPRGSRSGSQRARGGDPRLPGRDGARDRRRGSADRDRAVRSARRSRAPALRARNAGIDDRDRRCSHALPDGARRPPRRRASRARTPRRSPRSRGPPSATAPPTRSSRPPARSCSSRPRPHRSRPGPGCSRRSRARPAIRSASSRRSSAARTATTRRTGPCLHFSAPRAPSWSRRAGGNRNSCSSTPSRSSSRS